MPAPPGQTIYRPPPVNITADQVRVRLTQFERAFQARWIMLIVLGSCATMFGPLIVGSLIWLAQFNSRSATIIQPWTLIVGETSLVMLPILFGVEWLTRGKMMDDAAESIGDIGPLQFMPGAGRGFTGLIFLEVCLWGPRIIIAGSKRLHGATRHGGADRSVAADIVHTFVVRDAGIGTAELLTLAGGREDLFSDALAYLMFYDLIGISRTGDRAWLLSNAPKLLRIGEPRATKRAME